MWNALLCRLRERLQRCHHDEGGQLSILTLVVLLGILVLLCLVVNVAHIVRHKLEAQNAADAIAITAATHMARGMNAITAANHVIGEMHALVILHHALGGDELDDDNDEDLTPRMKVSFFMFFWGFSTEMSLNEYVDRSYESADRWSKIVSPYEGARDLVNDEVTVKAAIFDSKIHLKRVLSYAYLAHSFFGKISQFKDVPYIGWVAAIIGGSGEGSAAAVQYKCWQEYKTLDMLESIARSLKDTKLLVRNWCIPTVQLYAINQTLPLFPCPMRRAEEAAVKLGKFHLAEGSTFPGLWKHPSYPLLQLPVEREPAEIPSADLWRTQLARAAVPWVHYWRLPLLQFGDDALKLSHFKSYYVKWTQSFILSETQRAREEGNVSIRLLVLKDTKIATEPKGFEEWTTEDGSRLADERFCLVGFALRPKPFVAAPQIFEQQHPEGLAAGFEEPNVNGIAAYAQAMTYNANPQRSNSRPPDRQSDVGWDTLNWDTQGRAENQVPEWRAGRDDAPHENTPTADFRKRAPEPKIRVNWQAMLVPSTRIAETPLQMSVSQPKLGRILRRTNLYSGSARTH